MNDDEIDIIPNDEDSQSLENGFSFSWFKLIIGVAICYFWLFDGWNSLIVLLSLIIVVVIHELGHVIIGKSFGCIIEEMQVFLLSFVSYKPKQVAGGSSWRNIKWSLGTLPLGGFTVFKERPTDAVDDAKEDLPGEYTTGTSPYIDDKPAWQRLLIDAGGVMFNCATFLIVYPLLPYLPSSWYYNCAAIALVSLIMAVFNFLPVFPLDGGRIIFAFYEMVTGKKPSQKFVNICGVVGFIIIILFFWIFPGWTDALIDPLIEKLF